MMAIKFITLFWDLGSVAACLASSGWITVDGRTFTYERSNSLW